MTVFFSGVAMASASMCRILIADPEIFNQATMIGTLKGYFRVSIALNREEIFKTLNKQQIDLILLETRFPQDNGFNICHELQHSDQFREIPVIFVSTETSVAAEEKGFNVGAFDYITKPYHAPTVLARIKNQLKLAQAMKKLKHRNQLALDANPNTGLPGNNSIRKELERVLTEKLQVCVIYADLDHFKTYNDCYGFANGDNIINFTANVIRVALQQNGCGDSFLGHIGGDDFIFVVPAEQCQQVTSEIIRRIEQGIPEFYNKEDRTNGYVSATGRDGQKRQHPLVSLSMGGIDLSKRCPETTMEIIDTCSETKGAAKQQQGSSLLLCQRTQ
jgi:diguanylate cyclase (GGDEF)-like protein